MMKGMKIKLPFLLCCLIAITLLAMPAPAMAKHKHQSKTPDWCFVDPEPEIPSENYDSMLYSEIAPRLCEIQKPATGSVSRSSGSRPADATCFWSRSPTPWTKKGNGTRTRAITRICAS
jgi:hypothetical protein